MNTPTSVLYTEIKYKTVITDVSCRNACYFGKAVLNFERNETVTSLLLPWKLLTTVELYLVCVYMLMNVLFVYAFSYNNPQWNFLFFIYTITLLIIIDFNINF
jgi:hypothetical protein